MKKNVFLLQFRENKLVAQHERKCIARYLGKRAELISQNIFLDNFNFLNTFFLNISAVVLGGSDFSFSEKEKYRSLWKKIEKTTPILKQIIQKNIPSLGICFGHQYLAYVLGAEIIRDNSQQEVGTFKILLTKAGRMDSLFFQMPSEFFVQEAHKDIIKNLPPGVILLAESKKCKIQSFRYKDIYGVQFHPELNARDMKIRANFYPSYVAGENISFTPSLFGKKILNNFFDIYILK